MSNINTISQLINYFETISLSHNYINAFKMGNQYEVDENGNNTYPLAFLEMPLYTQYQYDMSRSVIKFAYMVITDDINKAKITGEQILYYMQNDRKLILDVQSAISLYQFTDDDKHGYRWELETTILNDFCNYEDNFNIST